MNTQNTRTAIATGACLTLGVAAAVAMGAVPQVGEHGGTVVLSAVAAPVAAPATATYHHASPPATARVARVHHHSAAVTSHVALSRPAHSAAPAPALPAALVADVSAQEASGAAATAAKVKHPAKHHKKKRHAAKHHTAKHHAKKHHKKAHHSKKTKPAAPAKAPRTTPSASAISSAITGLRQYVHTPFTPTASQVAQFGDAVCGAFDKNQTFASVKSQILAQVKKLPFTTVTAGAADYVVKTAVKLYCPAYQSKVS